MSESADIAHAEFLTDAADLLSDVIWWHHGFSAAFATNPDAKPRQPDQHRLIALRINLQRTAEGLPPLTQKDAF